MFWWISHVSTQPENKCYCRGHLLFLSALHPLSFGNCPSSSHVIQVKLSIAGSPGAQHGPSPQGWHTTQVWSVTHFHDGWFCKAIQFFPVICYTDLEESRFLSSSSALGKLAWTISVASFPASWRKACLKEKVRQLLQEKQKQAEPSPRARGERANGA